MAVRYISDERIGKIVERTSNKSAAIQKFINEAIDEKLERGK